MIHIGAWVRRRPSWPGHLVESIRAERAVLRCGKEMAFDSTRGPLEVHDGLVSRASRPLDWRLCQGGCQRFGGG